MKDLNVMEFDERQNSDTPLGLLKGIKSGTETYQTLFKRLCRWNCHITILKIHSINSFENLKIIKKYLKIKCMKIAYIFFKRFITSYAGLVCDEVRGHSKSVGYEPGMKIKEDIFLNSWNVVLIMGDWWPVQCNWGAR